MTTASAIAGTPTDGLFRILAQTLQDGELRKQILQELRERGYSAELLTDPAERELARAGAVEDYGLDG
jgi:hypothetical protein